MGDCARYALSSDCDDNSEHPLIMYGCAAACQTCKKLAKDNGILYARNMWGNALQEYREQKLVQEVVSAGMK